MLHDTQTLERPAPAPPRDAAATPDEWLLKRFDKCGFPSAADSVYVRPMFELIEYDESNRNDEACWHDPEARHELSEA